MSVIIDEKTGSVLYTWPEKLHLSKGDCIRVQGQLFLILEKMYDFDTKSYVFSVVETRKIRDEKEVTFSDVNDRACDAVPAPHPSGSDRMR